MSPLLDEEDWPWLTKAAFSTYGVESEFFAESRIQSNLVSTNAWVAGVAVYIPFLFLEEVTVGRAHWTNGGTVAGNFEFAFWDSSTSTKLWTTGSVAQTTVSVIQSASATPVTLKPGRYYCMCAGSSTGLLLGAVFSNGAQSAAWIRAQTGVTLAVATATPVQPTTQYVIPLVTFTDGDTL